MVILMYWMGNLCCTNRRRQGIPHRRRVTGGHHGYIAGVDWSVVHDTPGFGSAPSGKRDHTGKKYKYVQYNTAAGPVAAVAGNIAYYYAPGGTSAGATGRHLRPVGAGLWCWRAPVCADQRPVLLGTDHRSHTITLAPDGRWRR